MQQQVSLSSDDKTALDQNKAVYEDGWAEINGRRYTFGKFTHKSRLKVFAFLTMVAPELESANFMCLVSPEFQPVEALICENVLFDGMQISKLTEHWETYEEDYIPFILTAMGAISYPFSKGVA